MMLTEDMRTTWVKALRSGDYVQGFGQCWNVEANTFCATGVVTCALGACPSDILETDAGGEIVNMNDAGLTFEAIADFIEAKPLEWFHA